MGLSERERKFLKNICNSVGHSKIAAGRCDRCNTIIVKRIIISTSPISAKPVIKWDELKIKTYPMFERMKDRGEIRQEPEEGKS